jgi:hypothetical protein
LDEGFRKVTLEIFCSREGRTPRVIISKQDREKAEAQLMQEQEEAGKRTTATFAYLLDLARAKLKMSKSPKHDKKEQGGTQW